MKRIRRSTRNGAGSKVSTDNCRSTETLALRFSTKLLLDLVSILFLAISASAQTVENVATPPPSTPKVDYTYVINIARDLANSSLREPASLPQDLRNLNYDEYRMIRFKRERALWGQTGLFNAEFFHPGFLYNVPVTVHEISEGVSRRIAFTSELFRFDDDAGRKLKPREDLGFAGFKLTYPLHRSDVQDEVAVFLGASYFRLVSRGLIFGISNRGLAVDTATPEGEEFPYFSEFWLGEPSPAGSSVTVMALLESKSVTGAYEFTVYPGQSTVVDTRATLFFRDKQRKYGLAPLTSMFVLGETNPDRIKDFRPEIHDSDGLLIRTGHGEGQWLWRPLVNPKARVRTSQFLDVNPRGFGLLQRDRQFSSYFDVEARYHMRPSIWIEPRGDWGAGAIELVEIPTDSEMNDNIVAYWVPKEVAENHFSVQYRMTVNSDGPAHSLAKVVRTLSEPLGKRSGGTDTAERRRFMIDFSSEELASLAANQPVTASIAMSAGRFTDLSILKNPDNKEWRLMFLAEREPGTATDIKASLSLHGKTLSENWLYLWDETNQ